MKQTIRTVLSCSKKVKSLVDIGAYYVVFQDRKPAYEISFRDGKTWARPFGAVTSVPFRPLFSGQLTKEEILRECMYY